MSTSTTTEATATEQTAEATNTETTEETTATETETATETTDNDDVAKWKAIARQNEKRAKENADKAKRFDEIEEASKTEAQKQADALAKLQAENEELRVAKLRSDVAAAKSDPSKGISIPAELLTGTTEAELEASADALLAFKGETPKAGTADAQGKRGEDIPDKTKQITREQLAGMTPDQIVKAKADGLLNDVLGITST